MKNHGDDRLITAFDHLPLTYHPERGAVSVQFSLRKIIRDMRAANLSYEDAVRALQESYIVEVLITHAYHLGRTAEELGIHRNTLARTIRELNIDIRKIRNTIR